MSEETRRKDPRDILNKRTPALSTEFSSGRKLSSHSSINFPTSSLAMVPLAETMKLRSKKGGTKMCVVSVVV